MAVPTIGVRYREHERNVQLRLQLEWPPNGSVQSQSPQQRECHAEDYPAASQSKGNLVARFDIQHGWRWSLNRADVGHFGGIQSLIDACLFERCREIFVIRFVRLSPPLQFFNLRTQVRKLFRPLLNIAKPGLKRLDLCLCAGDLCLYAVQGLLR